MITSAPKETLTPLMQQYYGLKARHPNDLLFFRLGDFYELFGADAQRAAPLLGVTLTHRQEVPMCGVPHHAVDTYIAKVLKAGHRVVIADQLEDPAASKGLVKRDVVRVVTPGTLQEDSLLSAKRSNYLAAVFADEKGVGLAVLECSTGEFLATELSTQDAASKVWDEIQRLDPSELVFPSAGLAHAELRDRFQKAGIPVSELPSIDFSPAMAEERLRKLFGTGSLRGFGLEGKPLALCAAGAAVRYLETTQCSRALSVRPLRTYSLDHYLLMDAHTLDHLDLVDGGTSRAPTRTLLGVIDQTLTPMGGRQLRRWLLAPLRDVTAIEERQDKVQFFVDQKEIRRSGRTALSAWPDTERILSRLTARTASARDWVGLGQALRRGQQLKALLQAAGSSDLSPSLNQLLREFPEEPALADLLEKALVEAPPLTLKEGGLIRAGYDPELDEVRSWIHDGKTRLLELEKREREQTGIPSLKVSFNNVFGYYLEVTRTHLARVPAHYVRKQTTANAERFITQELKEFETKILGAEERAVRIETALIGALGDEILKQAPRLQLFSQAVAELDVWLALAELAERRGYVRPTLDDSDRLVIREGRHPVLEEVLPSGTLVPNDLDLDGSVRQVLILTGPNMSGKSTYLRQTALIVILAQMGSYVPAVEAHVGVVDHIFTRIGASDRLSEGESTFMVEMVETAHILNHATARSLVILDEVGRGTSTYDGISIAWACLEYLNKKGERPGPKVLFATHYFELTQLAGKLSGVHNAHVTAREWGEEVVFLHKVEPGPADRAYGIHVARLAGIPKPVLEHAQELLDHLEENANSPRVPASPEKQPLLFDAPIKQPAAAPDSPSMQLQKELQVINLDQTTPLDALLKLQEWKRRYTSEKSKDPRPMSSWPQVPSKRNNEREDES